MREEGGRWHQQGLSGAQEYIKGCGNGSSLAVELGNGQLSGQDVVVKEANGQKGGVIDGGRSWPKEGNSNSQA